MTPMATVDAICAFLEQLLAEYTLPTEKGTEKTPQIISGWLPPKKNPKDPADAPDFPFIIVRLVEGEETEGSNMATIDLIFGVYSEDYDGRALLNLMEHTRQALFRKGVLENKFRIDKPYKFEVFDEQPYPQWFGIAETNWAIQNIYEEDEWLHGG